MIINAIYQRSHAAAAIQISSASNKNHLRLPPVSTMDHAEIIATSDTRITSGIAAGGRPIRSTNFPIIPHHRQYVPDLS